MRFLIECLECGKHFKQITNTHLRNKHCLSPEKYLEKYPHAVLISEDFKNTGEKNHFFGKTHDKETSKLISEKIAKAT